MKVTFWGTRGSIPVPGRETIQYGGNTTCVVLELQSGHRLIIDAGTGIRSLGDILNQSGEPLDLDMFVTHIHWDHIMGFPFFRPIYLPSTVIRIHGCLRSYKGIKATFDNKMGDGFFPVKFDDLPSKIIFHDYLATGSMTIGSTSIKAIELQHPQGGMGMRFTEDGLSMVFLTDNELRQDAWPGRTPTNYADFCSGADLLIHDCQYLTEEIAAHRGWGHSDVTSVIDLAIAAGVKRLSLFHHDPNRTDEQMDRLVLLAREIARDRGGDKLQIEAAVEGTTLDV
ncbi:MAG: MBL fold metallo-hydrolase [Deltaproteobacteria bacterium]|nr:MBL fold metallo-hydrolase [Deltaproteobacteria bacterium]